MAKKPLDTSNPLYGASGAALSITEFEQLFLSLAKNRRAYRPMAWRGPGGIGKTETFGRIAKTLTLTPAPLEFAHCAEEDAGGIPVRDTVTGQVTRLPIGPIRIASEQPALLFLDEVSRANEVKQGALLTLINERRAGDFRLHPETIVALAFNGTENVGAFKLIDVLANRITVIDALPTLEEVCNYLRALGDPESEDPYEVQLRDMGIDWAATAERVPQLIQITPAPGTIDNGDQYPSPRACVGVVKGQAQLLIEGMSYRQQHAKMAGDVSPAVANAYFAVRALRDNLPTAVEIAAEPEKAKLPGTIDTAVAVMALVEQAGMRDADAAWVYADRITQFEDIRVALGKRLTMKVKATTSKGIQSRLRMLSSQAKAVRGAI